jgi:alcohol dehydrogenase
LLTAQFYSPATLIVVDADPNRLEVAKRFGATHTIDINVENAVDRIFALTDGVGVDVAIEAVGIPASFDTCQQVIAPGGHIANVGVHGKSVELHLEKLWIQNINISTGLVNTNTTPMLLKTVQSGKIEPGQLITHRFKLDDILEAYEVFANAAKEKAIKVILSQ